jgi:hypothetical protein
MDTEGKVECSPLRRLNITNVTLITGILSLLVQQTKERKNTAARLAGVLPFHPLVKAQR